jgi:protease-4
MAQAALRARLVDKLGDRTAFGRRVAELAGADDEDVPGSFRTVTLDAFLANNPPAAGGGRIAVVTVSGTIMDGEGVGDTAGAETIVETIESGLRHRDLAALVVRVDSPGGSVTGSERIRRAIQSVRDRRIPVVISFGNVAASGGYWIATAGDAIFAEPSTITGSIGVFGVLPSFEGTLQRLGIGVDGVRTTPLSGEPDLLRGPSDEADRLLQMSVEATYRRFLGLVAQARKMPAERVHEIAQGRVWDGGTARQLGLVDRFGSLDDAIAEAARRANVSVEDAGVVWLEREPDFWQQFLGNMAGGGQMDASASRDPFARLTQRPELLLARAVADAEALVRGPALQARCLECSFAVPPPASARRVQPGTAVQRLAALFGM